MRVRDPDLRCTGAMMVNVFSLFSIFTALVVDMLSIRYSLYSPPGDGFLASGQSSFWSGTRSSLLRFQVDSVTGECPAISFHCPLAALHCVAMDFSASGMGFLLTMIC